MSDNKIYKVEFLSSNYTLRVSHVEDRYPIGFASVSVEDMDGRKTVRLHSLLRHPDFSGLGICFALLCERLSIGKSLGCVQAYTAVFFKHKNLIKLYKRVGFKRIKSLSSEYVRLVLDLSRVSLEDIEFWKRYGYEVFEK